MIHFIIRKQFQKKTFLILCAKDLHSFYSICFQITHFIKSPIYFNASNLAVFLIKLNFQFINNDLRYNITKFKDFHKIALLYMQFLVNANIRVQTICY